MIEAVEPNYVKFILIEVGTRLLALRLEKAQELAQKVIDRRKPGDPSPEGYIGNVYTRPELCLLFLRLFYKM